MRTTLPAICFLSIYLQLTAFAPDHAVAQNATRNRLDYLVDLGAINDDQLRVELIAPQIDAETITFFIPKIVPGIYGAEDYGRFVSGVEAFDKTGHSLVVKQLNKNSWEIVEAKRLHKLAYNVDDSWEEFEQKQGLVKYRSAGSSFDAGQRFIINHNCLFGYFTNMEDAPIQVTIHHPKEMNGSTSLTRTSEKPGVDIFSASSYYDLVDNPIVYGTLDSEKFTVANAEISLGVYSEDGEKHAAHFANVLKPLMEAQARYLGGKLPVDRYTFILVWEAGPKNSLLGDGLEHSHSTLVLLEGSDLVEATNFVRAICSHEFFHILMPLTIKSEEIANYDFNAPKQSQHLWLYEGMTEYATIHMPMVESLVDRHEFLQSIQTKIDQSRNFRDDVSLTQLSKNSMEHQDQYYNFYLKGMLACLCFDIELRALTEGEMGTQTLLSTLSEKYGKDGSFKDDELFDEITKLTKPEVREWFARYIEGTTPLPLKQTLAKVGIEYDEDSHQLGWADSPSDQQVNLRSQWLGTTTHAAHSPVDAAKVFDHLKSLVGGWEGKSDAGYGYTVRYSLSARDSVLVEHWHLPSGNDSMTLYHLDGDRLIATHYCPRANQPRLELTTQRDDGTLVFEFQSATNLKSEDESFQQSFQLRYNGSDSLYRNEDYSTKGKISSDAAIYSRSGTEEAKSSELHAAILEQDRLLFDAFFVSRDIDTMQRLLAKDVEFYHDKNGHMCSSADELLADVQQLWKLQDEGTNPKLVRKLIPESMKVYPLENFGAIQIADHQFYKIESDKTETLLDNARIVHLWQKNGGQWVVKRIISYDHQPAK